MTDIFDVNNPFTLDIETIALMQQVSLQLGSPGQVQQPVNSVPNPGEEVAE